MSMMLAPFVKLMNSLRYPHKFALIGLLLLLPFTVSVFTVVQSFEKRIDMIKREKQGLRYNQNLHELAQELMNVRRLSEQIVPIDGADRTFQTADKLKAHVDEHLKALIEQNRLSGDPYYAGTFIEGLGQHWEQLKSVAAEDERRDGYMLHTNLVDDIGQVMLIIADNAGVRSERDPVTKYMAQALVDKLEPLIGSIEEANVMLNDSGGSVGISKEYRKRLITLMQSSQKINNEFKTAITSSSSVNNGYDITLGSYVDALTQQTDKYITMLHDTLSNPQKLSSNLPAFNEWSALSIASGSRLFNEMVAVLEHRLGQHIHELGILKIAALLVSCAIVALIVLVFAGFYLSVIRSILLLQRTSQEVAAGRHVSMSLETKDELKEIETAYKQIAIIYEDAIRQKEAIENQLKKRALFDALTGTPNRFLFHNRVADAIVEADMKELKLGLLFIDLDGFKQINATSGHTAGDILLQQVAERLTSCLRETDTVARVGGDEFSVVLPELKTVHDAAHVADKVLRTFQKPFAVEQQLLTISASIGISLYPDDGSDAETLINKADMAMFTVKEQGKNGYRYFDPMND